jgi:O-acetyl-ADP-ribose deacetylase (regulator of RNase III)
MPEIQYVKGDATAPIGPDDTNKIIVHVCNDIGGWGAGFVLAISRRWEGPELAYRQWAKDGADFQLGQVQFVKVEPNLWVANLIGQRDIVRKQTPASSLPPIRYEAIKEGLQQIAQKALDLEASIHMPRIGCGLAGGKWKEMEPIIQEQLTDVGVSVTVYDFEAPPKKKKRPSQTGFANNNNNPQRPKTTKDDKPSM